MLASSQEGGKAVKKEGKYQRDLKVLESLKNYLPH